MFILCKHDRTVTLRYGFLGNGAARDTREECILLSSVTMDEDSISIDAGRFLITDTMLQGTAADNSATWHIEFAEREVFTGKYGGLQWLANPAPPLLSGRLRVDGDDYSLSNTEAVLYWDTIWGDEWPRNWFLLCGMNLKSDMSHWQLDNSFFLVQGVFGKKLSLMVQVGDECVSGEHRGNFHCTRSGNNVHWTVSIENQKTIFDIDVSCAVENTGERRYDSPLTNKDLLLVSGTARDSNGDRAEIRILRPVEKTLELIEFAHSDFTIAEYGNLR